VKAGLLSERVKVDSLELHPRNSRQGDVGAISQSLEAHGQYRPIVAQKATRRVLAGNHTLLAARSLGWAEIDVVWLDVDDEAALRVLLVDNRTNDLATYDDHVLADLLQELAQTPTGLTGSGYDGDALDELLADLKRQQGPVGVDEVTEPPAEPVTRPGDLWELGEHRLLCGDATRAEDYAIVLDGGSPDILWADPPYGVAIGDKNAMLNAHGRGNPHEGALKNDQGKQETESLWRAAFPLIRSVLPPGCPYYVCGPQGGGLGELLLLLLREGGLEARHILIWAKDRPTFSLGRLDYEYAHEPICYGWTPGAAHPWHAEGSASSLFRIDRPAASKLHPTMKPVELVEAMLTNSTMAPAIVLEPFGGSGTTLIAAENLGRVARLIEIDPGYCDVICRRFQNLTGIKPLRDGQPHDFLA
jgi:site-specific DNA-methyltransferase (adenine-specific)